MSGSARTSERLHAERLRVRGTRLPSSPLTTKSPSLPPAHGATHTAAPPRPRKSQPISRATMSAQTFTPNERILCYHGPLIYEAKILKADTWDETTTQTGVVGPHYYVHYKGWKQT